MTGTKSAVARYRRWSRRVDEVEIQFNGQDV